MTVLLDFIRHPIRTVYWLCLAHVINTHPGQRVRQVYRWDWRRGAWCNSWSFRVDKARSA